MLAHVAMGLRAFQFLFAIVVVALAATLLKAQVYGSAPVTTKYSTFTGSFGILVSLAGAAGLFFDAIPDLLNLALDGLSGLLFLAGGIAWAIGLRGISCGNIEDYDDMVENGLLNLGKVDSSSGPAYGVAVGARTLRDVFDNLEGNCKRGFADELFQFFAFGLAVGLVVVGYLRMRRGGSASYV